MRPCRSATAVRIPDARGRRRPGQDWTPDRRQDRARRPRGRRLRRRIRRSSSSSTRGEAPFPGEEGLEEALAELVPSGRLRASTDTTAAVAAGAELIVAVPPLSSMTKPVLTTGTSTPSCATSVAACSPERWSASRPPFRSEPLATASPRRWRSSQGCVPRRTSSPCTAPSGSTPAGSSRTWIPIRSSSAA